MLVVALTGGIGAGKTTVKEMLQQLGCHTINMDDIARQLSMQGQLAYVQIVQHFGDSILDNAQEIDRHKLANLIFDDSRQRQWLENLLHPMIEQHVRAELERIGHGIVIVEIPLLNNRNRFDFIDRVLVVETTADLQRQRVLQRDPSRSMDEISAIMDAQISHEQRRTLADDILYNTGSIEELEAQTKAAYQRWQQGLQT